jgi:hypothetical protein
MAETRLRSDQFATLDVDFQGRLSGSPTEVEVTWEYTDEDGIGTFEEGGGAEEGDTSSARFTPTPGKGGIAVVSWTAEVGEEIFKGSETFLVEGEGVVFVGQTVNVSDQEAPAV